MTRILTPDQMRTREARAIASGRTTGAALMESAGRAALDAVLAHWPALAAAPGRAVVLCGPGNNGGDGFVMARLLHLARWEVSAWLYGDTARLPEDARANARRWVDLGPLQLIGHPDPQPQALDALERALAGAAGDDRPALVIDALFGIGLRRPLTALAPLLARLAPGSAPDGAGADGAGAGLDGPGWDRQGLGAADWAGADENGAGENGAEAPGRADRPRGWHVVAVDLPSGLCGDSGRCLGRDGLAVRADLCVTFDSAKPGHYLAEGPAHCGALRIVDIGLDARGPAASPAPAPLPRPEARRDTAPDSTPDTPHEAQTGPRLTLATAPAPGLLRKAAGHKFSHGHAVILTGGPGRGGAARLAGRAALRIGAGLVTLACPPAALQENAARLDAIMLRRVEDEAALGALLQDPRITACGLGPGLGLGARQARLLGAALAGRGAGPALPLVLDADALTLLAADRDLFARLHPACVLTPHMGEFARLFPDLHAPLEAAPAQGPAPSKHAAVRAAAARAGCVVLLKGADTVIAAPGGAVTIHAAAYARAAPWLATAGSGDVLAGLITGLLARGHRPEVAARMAAWLHVDCARAVGPGLIAEDLPEALPRVLRRLRV